VLLEIVISPIPDSRSLAIDCVSLQFVFFRRIESSILSAQSRIDRDEFSRDYEC